MKTMFCLATVIAALLGVSGGSSAESAPATATATGTVIHMSPAPGLAYQTLADGSKAYCDIWQGALKTSGGQTIGFYVESAMSGTFPHLSPVDKAAVQTARTLVEARGLGKVAMTTITYSGPMVDCGYGLPEVVTAAVIKVTPRSPHKTTGRVAYISRRETIHGDGAVCASWHGSIPLDVSESRLLLFNIESPVTDGRVGARALRLVKTLAYAEHHFTSVVATVTYSGPYWACGLLFPRLVTAVSLRHRPGPPEA